MFVDVPCVEISIKPTVHFASDTTITSIVTSMPPPEKAQWQKSKHRIDFSEVDVTKSKYFGSNASPQCPSLVIPKTTFDDIGYYRLQISNKLGLNVSNSVYLNVTGSMFFQSFIDLMTFSSNKLIDKRYRILLLKTKSSK